MKSMDGGRIMIYFKQNNELTIPEKPVPLVAENSFINKEQDRAELPVFEEIKDKLPLPVWEGHEDYINCYWKTWSLAFGNLRKPNEGTTFVSNFIDTAFNDSLFMWDSAFILMFGKYAQRIFNFQGTLDNMYSHQHRDGYICREINTINDKDRFTRYDVASTGPNIMAWCEWDYYLNFGDKERLAKVFPPLMAYHRWMAEHRTWQDGTYFSSGWGCGMDNIPRLMPGYSTFYSHGHMVWVDACMQALNNCNILINMAKILERNEFINDLEYERDNLCKVINEKLWDEETGFYYDLWKNGELNGVMHIGAFWALLSECAPKDRAERLIAHLSDEKSFKTPNRVPALARSDKNYEDAGKYWRGGVWAPTNYMVLKGLDKYKNFELAHEIAMDYLRAVVDVFKKTDTLFENYAPEYIDGEFSEGNPAKSDFVGWTGLAPVSILFEYVFGIKPDAANNKIVWDVNLLEEHGIKNYPFGTDGTLTLICKKRTDENEKPQIIFESDIPLTLEVRWGKENQKQSMIY